MRKQIGKKYMNILKMKGDGNLPSLNFLLKISGKIFSQTLLSETYPTLEKNRKISGKNFFAMPTFG